MRNLQPTFEVTVTNWTRDVRGLFDYSAPNEQYQESTFSVSDHCRVYRDNIHGQNYFHPSDRRMDKAYSYVCQLDLDSEGQSKSFWLRWRPREHTECISAIKTPFLVLNHFTTFDELTGQKFEGYPIKLGNVIKLGQIQFTVVEVKTDSSFYTLFQQTVPNQNILGEIYVAERKEEEQEATMRNGMREEQEEMDEEVTQKKTKHRKIKKEKKIDTKTRAPKKLGRHSRSSSIEEGQSCDIQQEQNQLTINFTQKQRNKSVYLNNQAVQKQKAKPEEQKTCRICLMLEQNPDDPFVSPCLCRGSCQMIHISCLKQWVRSRTTVQDVNQVKSYRLSKPCCEICKHPLPKLIKFSQKNVHMVHLDKPSAPYIILQSSNHEQTFKDERHYIVIPGNSVSAKIGRSNDAQIKLTDITISRRHAEIFYKDDAFYVKDLGSKFGTLLKLQSDFKFDYQTIQVQVGRCLYEFTPLEKENECDSDSEMQDN